MRRSKTAMREAVTARSDTEYEDLNGVDGGSYNGGVDFNGSGNNNSSSGNDDDGDDDDGYGSAADYDDYRSGPRTPPVALFWEAP